MDFEGCNYMTFRMEHGRDIDLLERLYTVYSNENIDPMSLVASSELPVFEKYDEYIPSELLRHAYSVDRLNISEAVGRLSDILSEYEK